MVKTEDIHFTYDAPNKLDLACAVCLQKVDMTIWLTYILMYLSEFKLMLMPNLKDFGQLCWS